MKIILLNATRNVPENACISHSYIKAAMAAGLPMVAAGCNPQHAAEYASQSAGLIITGGGDIDPKRFGQRLHPKVELVEAEQDEFDFALFHAFHSIGKPVLGICRGMQVINVALGGSMIQHIPDEFSGVEHSAEEGEATHIVVPTGKSFLGLDAPETVNSAHHQAIGRLGDGLRAVAASEDGVVEAMEGKGVIGVQWHPERFKSRLSEHIFSFFAGMVI